MTRRCFRACPTSRVMKNGMPISLSECTSGRGVSELVLGAVQNTATCRGNRSGNSWVDPRARDRGQAPLCLRHHWQPFSRSSSAHTRRRDLSPTVPTGKTTSNSPSSGRAYQTKKSSGRTVSSATWHGENFRNSRNVTVGSTFARASTAMTNILA